MSVLHSVPDLYRYLVTILFYHRTLGVLEIDWLKLGSDENQSPYRETEVL
jgi:hypothetical protein